MFLLAPTLSIGASFDCEKASTKHEKKIWMDHFKGKWIIIGIITKDAKPIIIERNREN